MICGRFYCIAYHITLVCCCFIDPVEYNVGRKPEIPADNSSTAGFTHFIRISGSFCKNNIVYTSLYTHIYS